MDHQILSPSKTIELVKRAQDGCLQSRDKLIFSNMRFIYKVCRKYATETVSADDLMADGILGLIEAIEKYDTSGGAKLLTLGGIIVHQKVCRSPLLSSIRLPEMLGQALRITKQTIGKLEKEGNFDPTDAEIAAETGLEPSKIKEIRTLINAENTVSLDAPLDEDSDKIFFSDVLPASAENFFHKLALEDVLRHLSKEEAFVLARSYGFPNEMKNYEIAEAVSRHENDITGIRRRALEKCQQVARKDDYVPEERKEQTQTIFLVTCQANEKKYVGATRLPLSKRLYRLFYDGPATLKKDVEKYGRDNFSIKPLQNVSKTKASTVVAREINRHRTNCQGYNSSPKNM